MSLRLYYHPLSSFCWKALIALYENATPFEPVLVDLMAQESRANFLRMWPIGKFPVLRDEARGVTVPETSIIIEYLQQHYPGRVSLIPIDSEQAREVRQRDRIFDLYVHQPMQKIVTDRLRPAGAGDGFGVEQARASLDTAYEMIDSEMRTRTWSAGDAFTMADCAAFPALFYANRVQPFGAARANLTRYLGRLQERASVARVVKEAQPYFHMVPQ
jgi:glutathione S-transferase